jgi:uncharacterized protein (DUF4415 family)
MSWSLGKPPMGSVSSVSEKPTSEKERNMVSHKPVIDSDGEIDDLSKIDKTKMKPFAALPLSLQTKLKGRPKAAVTKERISIRLSPDVVQTFRATGEGWQTRIDAALKEWLIMQKVAATGSIKRGLELLDKLDQADQR